MRTLYPDLKLFLYHGLLSFWRYLKLLMDTRLWSCNLIPTGHHHLMQTHSLVFSCFMLVFRGWRISSYLCIAVCYSISMISPIAPLLYNVCRPKCLNSITSQGRFCPRTNHMDSRLDLLIYRNEYSQFNLFTTGTPDLATDCAGDIWCFPYAVPSRKNSFSSGCLRGRIHM